MTRTFLDILTAANLASTIARAFEAQGIGADMHELHEQLCGIELDYQSPVTITGVVDAEAALTVSRCFRIIAASVSRVDAVYDAAMLDAALQTRAVIS